MHRFVIELGQAYADVAVDTARIRRQNPANARLNNPSDGIKVGRVLFLGIDLRIKPIDVNNRINRLPQDRLQNVWRDRFEFVSIGTVLVDEGGIS